MVFLYQTFMMVSSVLETIFHLTYQLISQGSMDFLLQPWASNTLQAGSSSFWVFFWPLQIFTWMKLMLYPRQAIVYLWCKNERGKLKLNPTNQATFQSCQPENLVPTNQGNSWNSQEHFSPWFSSKWPWNWSKHTPYFQAMCWPWPAPTKVTPNSQFSYHLPPLNTTNLPLRYSPHN